MRFFLFLVADGQGSCKFYSRTQRALLRQRMTNNPRIGLPSSTTSPPLVGMSPSYFRTAAWHVGAIHEVKHRG